MSGNSRDRRKIERVVERKIVEAESIREAPGVRMAPDLSFPRRLLGFIEQPLFLWAVGTVTTLAGFLIRPLLFVSGICIVLAFHRAKVVEGKPWWVRLLSYAALMLVTVALLAVFMRFIESQASRSQEQLLQAVVHGVESVLTRETKQASLQQPVSPKPASNQPLKAPPIRPPEPGINLRPAEPGELRGNPDYIHLFTGSSMSEKKASSLKDGVNLDDLTNIDFADEKVTVGIWLGQSGKLEVAADLRGLQDRNIQATAKGGKFEVFNPRWDANYDQKAFEVVNEYGVVVFRVERTNWDTIHMGGIFIVAEENTALCVGAESTITPGQEILRKLWRGQVVEINKKPFVPYRPIFKYPRSQFLGVRR